MASQSAAAEWQEHEDVYHGAVPVVLKSADREDRSASLTVAITHTTGQPRNQKVLHVQLTDESDAFLLYTLEISEDDFHALKTEQNILVDFHKFPANFVELLRECQSAAAEEHPRFVAQLSTLGGEPVLTVTETNSFRQLAHLALRFVAGNDAAIKRHLAGRVAEFKAQLLATSDELGERTSQLESTSERAAAQADRLRTLGDDHARELSELGARHAGQLAAAKEAAAASQQELSTAASDERQRLLERSEAELRAMRHADAESQARLAQLTSSTHELELKQRESLSRLQGSEQEVQLLRKESLGLREENAQLSSTVHRLEKALSSRDVELAAASQSAADKEALLSKMAALQEAASEAKRQLEDSLNLYKETQSRMQAKLQLSASEIAKGNGIIAKLQSDARELKGKVKLKAQQLTQQQEAAAAKEAELTASEKAVHELRAQAAELRADKERADESGAAARQQLTEAQELLRSNQQVIGWLNKELNESQSGSRPYLGASASRLVSSSLGSFRPSLPSPPAATPSGLPSATTSPPSQASSVLSTSQLSASLTPTGVKVQTPTGASASSPSAALASPVAPSKPGAVPGASHLEAGGLSAAATSLKPPAAARLNFESTNGADAYVPGAALASLRSRAGLALAENLTAADGARLGAAGTDSTNATGGGGLGGALGGAHGGANGGAFADYLSPSSSSTSYGGTPLGIA